MPDKPPESTTPEKVLVVDDLAENLTVLSATLEVDGYEILAASSGSDALRIAARARPGLVLLDVMMPGLDGLETCRQLKADPATRNIPVIFITARDDAAGGVDGFRAGGVDYVVKPFRADEVRSRVATHLRLSRLTQALQEQNRMLAARTAELTAESARRHEAETALRRADETLERMSRLEAERWNVTGLIGESRQVARLVADIERLHQFPGMNVLITGESGTGKELVARAIHFGSARARAPFVPVNCVAIPADLAESILFGHMRGAFTGATADRKGCFELADGGTLFLDEIGDMPATLQVKLLRVLEDGFITPVGATQPRHVDVRIVAATNADLEARIASGAFRSDLYFRLARYTISTAPLRERIGDVPLLATHFLRRFAEEMNLKAPALTAAALQALQAYAFPGNIRELKNIVERAVIDAGPGPIQPVHLSLFQRTTPHSPSAITPVSATADTQRTARHELASTLPLNLAEAEDLLIQRALQQTGGNIADAARLLGIHRTRIYRKLAQESPTAGATDE